MLLLQQLKPLGVSTWRQNQSFADRIRNRYLLPGYYSFMPLYLIWRMGNHAGNLLEQGPTIINLKLLMEQKRYGSRINASKLVQLPVTATGKSGIQAFSSSIHRVLLERVLRNQLTRGATSTKMNLNPGVLHQDYSMVEKPGRTSWLPELPRTYPDAGAGHRYPSALSPGNNFTRENNLLRSSNHIRVILPGKPAHKPIQTYKLPGTARQNFSLTIPVKIGRSRQAPIREGLSPGDGGPLIAGVGLTWLNTPAVNRIAPGPSIDQMSGKGPETANSTDILRWNATQPITIRAVSRLVDPRRMLPKHGYGLNHPRNSRVNRTYAINNWSQKNDLTTGPYPTKGMETDRTWSANPAIGMISPGQALALNILPAFNAVRGQVGNHYLNYYIQRHNQVSRRRKTDYQRVNLQLSLKPARLLKLENNALNQVKQPKSLLLARPLISEKTILKQVDQRLSLKSVRSMKSENTALDQVKQPKSQLLTRPFISEKTVLGRVNQQLSLKPVRSMKSENTALDQVKQPKSLLLVRPLIYEKTILNQVNQQLSLKPARSLKSENTALDQVKQPKSLLPARPLISEKTILKQVNQQLSLKPARSMKSEYNALDQVKQPKSLLPARPSISEKTVLERVYQQLSLKPARSLKSENNALDQVKQLKSLLPTRQLISEKNALERAMRLQRLYNSAFLAARPVGPDARIKVQNETGSAQSTSYPVSYPVQFSRHSRIRTSENRSGIQLGRDLPYVNEKVIPGIYGSLGYGNAGLRNIELNNLQSGFNAILSKQSGNYSKVLEARNSLTKNSYRDNARSRFYPALPVAASTGAEGVLLPWQNRVKTVWKNIRVPDNAISRQLIKETKKRVQADSRSNVTRSGLIPNPSEVVPTRLLNPAWFGENQRKSDHRSHYTPDRKSKIVRRTIAKALTGQPALKQNNNHDALLKLPLPGWRKHSLVSIIYHKKPMTAAEKAGQRWMGLDTAARSQIQESPSRARYKLAGRNSSCMADQVLPLLGKSVILRKYREHEDQRIPVRSMGNTNIPYAKLSSNLAGPINNRNQDFLDTFRPRLTADSGKRNLSILTSGSSTMIMRKSGESTNSALAPLKRSGEINSGRGRAKAEPLNFINQSSGMTGSKLGLISEKQLKHFQQKQIRSDRWPEWFTNKKSGFLKNFSTNGEFKELAGNRGSRSPVSNLVAYPGVTGKENQLLRIAAKIMPFKQSARLSQGAYQSGPMMGYYINRSGQQKATSKDIQALENGYYINRLGNRGKHDNHNWGAPWNAGAGIGLPGNAAILPVLKMVRGVNGRSVFAGSPQGKSSRGPSERWLNRYMEQSRVNGNKNEAGVFNTRRDTQAGLALISRVANKSLIAGDKRQMPINHSNQNLISYAGIKAGNDKRLPFYSTLASGPDLNYRRDTSAAASKMAPSAVDTNIASINTELKMQMAGTRNAELKNVEIKKIADRVYREIQQRMKSERQRRGL